MSTIQALILGILQGLTEYLPVSSSGHLTIAQTLFGGFSGADNLMFDVVLHVATVLSTIVVLWKEIASIFKGFFTPTGWRVAEWNNEKHYVAKILVSMIPVFIVGMFFKDFVEEIFGSGLLIVGICLIITAALLTFSYFAKPRQKDDISYLDAFIIGIAQAIAVLPGLSRSGSTIATGLLLGDKKEKVAQFSFLMVIIPILGEAFLECVKGVVNGGFDMAISWTALLTGFLAAFISGCLACKFMLEIVKKGKLIWFAVYCVIVGCVAIICNV
ncbi:MAG: undecaprenyl-diphosphate phosphatase [Paludibacteraceae bacterium]|nr:undecaprenyl-diphosphate phosphatase [Paludibacteraceae bacterium]